MKKTAALLAMLMLCACAGRARLYAVPLPPPPVDIKRPVGTEMLPDLKCLQTTGQPCPGGGLPTAPSKRT